MDQKPGGTEATAATLAENHTLSPLSACLSSGDGESRVRAETERKVTQMERNKTGSEHFPSFDVLPSKFSSPNQVALETHSLLDIYEEEKHSNPFHYLVFNKRKKPTIISELCKEMNQPWTTFSPLSVKKPAQPPRSAKSQGPEQISGRGWGPLGDWRRKCELTLMRERDFEIQLSS